MINKRKVNLNIICDVVCKFFDIEPELMFKRCRYKHIVTARQWFFYLSRELNPYYAVPHDYIGEFPRYISGEIFDHATVIHSHKKISGLIEVYHEDLDTKHEMLRMINHKLVIVNTNNKYCHNYKIHRICLEQI